MKPMKAYYAIIDCEGYIYMESRSFPTDGFGSTEHFPMVGQDRDELEKEVARLNRYEDVDNRPLRVTEICATVTVSGATNE